METEHVPSLSALEALVQQAWKRRQSYHADATLDCYRAFHGYSEGYPGLSIDRYGGCVVVNKKAALPFSDEDLARLLNSLGDVAAIVMKTHQKIPESFARRVRYLDKRTIAAPLRVKEADAYYFADPCSLHTNGFYLDTRPARRWLRLNSAHRRVLNLFAHTGSLGVAARLGGANEVVYVDKQQALLQKVLLSYKFNGLVPDDRGLLAGDLYFHLPRAIKWGQKFSGIILDPPPRVPVPPKTPLPVPVGQDFARLVATCCDLLDDGAWLLCIYHNHTKDHSTHDQEVTVASSGRLTPFWQACSDDDFPEAIMDRRTRMTAFKFSPG